MSVGNYNLNPFSGKGGGKQIMNLFPPPGGDPSLVLPPPPPPIPVMPQKRPPTSGGTGVAGPYQGPGSTILTGPQGLPSPAVTGQKTLLGQ